MPHTLPPPVSDLERRMGFEEGSLAAEDLARAEEALADATVLALAEVRAPQAVLWTAAAPDVVRLVILKAARREFDNPRGLTNESLGEHSVGLSDASGVYLTAREIAQIHRVANGRSGGFVGTVRIATAYSDD